VTVTRDFQGIGIVTAVGLVQVMVLGRLAFDPAGGLGNKINAFLVLALLTIVPVVACFFSWFRSGQRAIPIASQILAFCSLALCTVGLAIPGHTVGAVILFAFVAQYAGSAVALFGARPGAT